MKASFACTSSVLLSFALGLAGQGPPPHRGPGGFRPGFDIMSAGPQSRTPITGAPYSAVQTTQFQQVLAGGNTITHDGQSKVYRDNQGRVRIEHTAPASAGEPARTIVTIFDPVAGKSYVLNPANQTARSMPAHMPPPGRNWGGMHERGHRDQAQMQTENLGTQVVNGVSATGTRITETIAAGAIGNAQPIQVVRETWVSNDLKVPVLIRSSDPRFGNTVMQLTNIVQAEPDASLFQVPSGYTVDTHAERPWPSMRRRD